VRFTCASKSRSTTSFTAHPAERIRNVPTVKMITGINEGEPSAAIQSAVRVGQTSSSVPIGLSSRVSLA